MLLVDPCLPARFWAKVDVDGSFPTEGPTVLNRCWLWTAGLNDGYGTFAVRTGIVRRAHRLTREQFVGPVPDGLVLDHLCRRRNCVNPWHTVPKTIGDNVLAGVGPVQDLARADRCKNGHPFDEENTYWIPNPTPYTGRRKCRACGRERKRAA